MTFPGSEGVESALGSIGCNLGAVLFRIAAMQVVEKILQKTYQGKRITPEEGLTLLQSGEFQKVGQAADYVRRQKCPDTGGLS